MGESRSRHAVGNGFDTRTDHDLLTVDDDASRCGRNRVQTRRAVATDRDARGFDGAAGLHGGEPTDVVARCALGRSATEDHFVDFGRFDAGSLDRMLDRVARHRDATGVVESASMTLGEPRTSG